MDRKIILLDLNYTLVSNRNPKKPLKTELPKEEYRQWLVELIKDHYVILITARPQGYEKPTLMSIKTKTDWLPQESYFNFLNFRPPAFKQRILTRYVFPIRRGMNTNKFLAIESNPKTRSMYHRNCIKTVFVEDGVIWNELPEGTLEENKE